jgi:hypothetical protein
MSMNRQGQETPEDIVTYNPARILADLKAIAAEAEARCDPPWPQHVMKQQVSQVFRINGEEYTVNIDVHRLDPDRCYICGDLCPRPVEPAIPYCSERCRDYHYHLSAEAVAQRKAAECEERAGLLSLDPDYELDLLLEPRQS